MEAPKTIYLQLENEDQDPYQLKNLDEGTTWCRDKVNDDDVEYIRKDLYDKLSEHEIKRIAEITELIKN